MVDITRVPVLPGGTEAINWDLELTKLNLPGHGSRLTQGYVEGITSADGWVLLSPLVTTTYPIVFSETSSEISVVSTSAEDDDSTDQATRLGVGVVRIFTIDDDGNAASPVNVPLAGTTPVATGVTGKRCVFAVCRRASTNAASTYRNVGDIRIFNSAGNLAIIPAQDVQSKTASNYVPTNYRAIGTKMVLSTNDLRARVGIFYAKRGAILATNTWNPLVDISVTYSPNLIDLGSFGIRFPDEADLVIMAKAESGSSTNVYATFQHVLLHPQVNA